VSRTRQARRNVDATEQVDEVKSINQFWLQSVSFSMNTAKRMQICSLEIVSSAVECENTQGIALRGLQKVRCGRASSLFLSLWRGCDKTLNPPFSRKQEKRKRKKKRREKGERKGKRTEEQQKSLHIAAATISRQIKSHKSKDRKVCKA